MKSHTARHALALALILCGPAPALADDAPDLWTPAPGAAAGRAVIPDPDVLERMGADGLRRISVTAGGKQHEVVLEEPVGNGRGVRSYRGAVPDAAGSYLLLTVGPGDAAAALFEPFPGERWRLHRRDGLAVLEPVDPAGFAPCAGGLAAPEPLPRGGERPEAGSRAFGDDADDGSRHDVLVAWSPKTEAAAGGAAQMEAEIQLSVDAANMVYANSGVASRLRLVYADRTEYDEDSAWTYEDHIYALADPTDGVMDEVPQLRTLVGADFMVLFVESTDALGNPIGACGVGYVMQPGDDVPGFEILAVSVVTRHCASSVWTLAHEIGHNRGCTHNREDASIDGLTSYAYGNRFTGNDGQAYRTVMSYDTNPESMTRVPHFANPAIPYAGTPTGVPVGDPGESHTVQVQNITDTLCAGFRPERSWVDFDWIGASTGLVDAPFSDLAAGLAHARRGGQVVLRGNAPGFAAVLGDAGVLISLDAAGSVMGAP